MAIVVVPTVQPFRQLVSVVDQTCTQWMPCVWQDMATTYGTRSTTAAVRKYDELISNSVDVVYTAYTYANATVLNADENTYDVDFVVDILEPLSLTAKHTSAKAEMFEEFHWCD